LAWRDVGGLREFNFDIVRAADSLTGDVMIMVMLIVVVVIVVIVVLLSAWVGGRVGVIRRRG